MAGTGEWRSFAKYQSGLHAKSLDTCTESSNVFDPCCD